MTFEIFLLILAIFVVFLIVDAIFTKRKRNTFRNIETPHWTPEVAGAAEELAQNAENATDHVIAARLMRFNRLENNPRNDIHTANAVFREFTRALIEMDDTEIPFVMDQAEMLEQDMLWRIIDTEPAMQFHYTLQTMQPQRERNAQQIAAAAIETSASPAEAVNKLDTELKKQRSDPQNVHDPKVNDSLRETLKKLKGSYRGEIDCIKSVKKYLKGHPKEAKCLKTLAEIEKDGLITTYNDTELNIFSYVWERCYLEENEEQADNMREAIVEALADSNEGGGLVCINGRCSRLLASLVLLDYDPTLATAMTFDAYKNQIYSETKDILEAELLKYSQSGDLDKQQVAQSYKDGSECDADIEAEFKQKVKKSIDKNLSDYVDKLTEHELAQLRSDCYMYVDVT